MTNQEALTTYRNYVEAWQPITDEKRKSILSAVLEPSLEYNTPQFVGGTDAVVEDMERFQKQYPGAHFDIENVSTHHEVALFKWVLVLHDGKVTVKGHDCVHFAPGGTIARIITFGPGSPKP